MNSLSRLPVALNGQPGKPAANQYATLFDSTRLEDSVDGFIAPSDTLPTAGSQRGLMAGLRVDGTIACTGQNVTLLEYVLDSAGWHQTKSTTITAGAAPTAFSFIPKAADGALIILAGGTAPTTLVTTAFLRTEA